MIMGTVERGDTLLYNHIEEITIYGTMSRKKKRYLRRYGRLESKVRKVYPLAKTAGVKLREYNDYYLELKTEREQKRFFKRIEKELLDEYEGTIKKMTLSEGRILIRLIDRETGDTSYEIIKEFRGGFSAFFWQSIARIFGNNLKDNYDPQERDRVIELIIHKIEMERHEQDIYRNQDSTFLRSSWSNGEIPACIAKGIDKMD